MNDVNRYGYNENCQSFDLKIRGSLPDFKWYFLHEMHVKKYIFIN